MLVMSSLGMLLSFLVFIGVSYIPDFLQETDITTVDLIISIAIFSTQIFGCILIFNWRKIGVHLFVTAYILDFIYRITSTSETSRVGSLITGLILFYFLIKNAYKHMK